MFQIAHSGEIAFLQARNFLDCNVVVHAFCTRRGGVSEGAFASLNMAAGQGDGEERVRENWRLISRSFDIPEHSFFVMDQVHGDGVLVIRDNLRRGCAGPFPAGDACVTQRPGVALCIKTADCVPIFLLDPHRRVIGAVHAGWEGTALSIAGRAVDVMVEKFECRPEEILAAIGPSIGPCCYEVDSRVYLAMRDQEGAEKFFSPGGSPGKWMLNLPLANTFQLLGKGLRSEHTASSGYCTSCLPDLFFSHRRDAGKTGRHVNFILLRDEAS